MIKLQLYFYSFKGIPIAFGKVKAKRSYGSIEEERPYLHFDCQIDFIVFQPTVGSQLEGVVNNIELDHASVLVHNTFNAPIYGSKSAASLKLGQHVVIEVRQLKNYNGVNQMRCNLIEAL